MHTDDANDQLAVLTVNAYHQRIVHDIDLSEELAVVEQSSTHDPLRVFTQVEWVEMCSYRRRSAFDR